MSRYDEEKPLHQELEGLPSRSDMPIKAGTSESQVEARNLLGIRDGDIVQILYGNNLKNAMQQPIDAGMYVFQRGGTYDKLINADRTIAIEKPTSSQLTPLQGDTLDIETEVFVQDGTTKLRLQPGKYLLCTRGDVVVLINSADASAQPITPGLAEQLKELKLTQARENLRGGALLPPPPPPANTPIGKRVYEQRKAGNEISLLPDLPQVGAPVVVMTGATSAFNEDLPSGQYTCVSVGATAVVLIDQAGKQYTCTSSDVADSSKGVFIFDGKKIIKGQDVFVFRYDETEQRLKPERLNSN